MTCEELTRLLNHASLDDLKTGRCLRTLVGHRDEVKALAFSPDSRRLATASLDGTAKIWEVTPATPEPAAPRQPKRP
ncbi:MAG: WD40 repeat domain-containing protein [Planctomycetota bacterium]